jgi:precorrin-2 dehydrogenase/sirohydrochlorin ferrochelatase
METFPAFFPLRGKRVVIAGEGEPADAKARLFADSPADVVRLNVADAMDIAAYAKADLIFIASWDADFREAAAAVARTAGAPLNVVDAPDLSDFHTPAIIDRGQVVAAIGTAGASPLLASLLRSEMEALVPEGAGRVAALFGQRRESVRAAFPDLALRRAFLRSVLAGPAAAAAAAGDTGAALEILDRAIEEGGSARGRVCLIECGAAPDLIPLRAARVLAVADVVFAGPEAEALLDHHGRRDAERPDPATATAEALAGLTALGRIVAIVGARVDGDLAALLRARGVEVETLTAAAAT